MGQFIFGGGVQMERVVCRGERNMGGFVHLTKVANAEKHAFYTVTLFPIFFSEKFAKQQKEYTPQKNCFLTCLHVVIVVDCGIHSFRPIHHSSPLLYKLA
jgi:hypothetical protein